MKIKDVSVLESFPKLFGYLCLGSITPECFKDEYYLTNIELGNYRLLVEYSDGIEFEIFLICTSDQNKYIVLGDTNSLPVQVVIEEENFLDFLNKNFSSKSSNNIQNIYDKVLKDLRDYKWVYDFNGPTCVDNNGKSYYDSDVIYNKDDKFSKALNYRIKV